MPARPTLRKAANVAASAAHDEVRRERERADARAHRHLRRRAWRRRRAARGPPTTTRPRRPRTSSWPRRAASAGAIMPPSVAITDRRARCEGGGGVKALAKSEARPGIWLVDAPEPEVGINDVLIRVLRTGICGTDLHIRAWDAWAQRTIPVPMVVGHEFAGEVVEIGSNVNDFAPGRHRQRRGPPRVRPLPQLHGRAPAPLRAHPGRRRRPHGRVRRAHLAADDERLEARAGHRPGRGLDLRSLRQRRAHRARVPRARGGRADHGRRADRDHGGRRRAPRGRAARGRHRHEPATGWSWRGASA